MQKQGLLLEATGPKPESVVVKDVSSSELQIKIAELTAELKKMEFEKRDLEFNLNRRLTDFKSQSEMNDQLKNTIESSSRGIRDFQGTKAFYGSTIVKYS